MLVDFMGVVVRRSLLALFAVLALLFLASAPATLANHFLEFSPNKISAELPTTVGVSVWGLCWGFAFTVLFVALLRRRPWFRGTYWFTYLVGVANILFIVLPLSPTTWPTDLLFLALVLLSPVGVGFYISSRRYQLFDSRDGSLSGRAPNQRLRRHAG